MDNQTISEDGLKLAIKASKTTKILDLSFQNLKEVFINSADEVH
jgi:hypothetical protein